MNAPGPVGDAHVAAASIYRHAAGNGADLAAHAHRAEHFGRAPTTAMSVGAAPVVFDAAGPAAVVQPDVNGQVFDMVDEQVVHSGRLIEDLELRGRLAASSVASARHSRRERFEDDKGTLVHDVTSG